MEIAWGDHKICPVVCLHKYIKVTKQHSEQSSTGLHPNHIFIDTKPHTPMQACTIAHWVQTVMQE